MSVSGKHVGIDLGTTISAVAHLDDHGGIVTLPNRDGDPLTPSAVYLDGETAVVGKAAKEAAAHAPDNVATFIKRDMGRATYSRAIGGRFFRPETLSAIILKKLKQDAERRIGKVSHAAITVPAYFDDARRKATRDAGRIAGFDDVEIINEPTAAALAFSLERQISGKVPPILATAPQTVLVYDLGGGTFDVSVVRIAGNRVDTIATDGAVELGGKDWDDRIVDHLVKQFRHQYNVEIPATRRLMAAGQAESAKKLLSQLPVTRIEYSYERQSVSLQLSRQQFEEMTRDLLMQTEAVTNLVVEQAGQTGNGQPLTWNGIHRVLMVGGSTRMPMVHDMLRRVTGREPDDSLDPDQAVARGAALFASIRAARSHELAVDGELSSKLQRVIIHDVNSHSLGVAARDPASGELVSAVLVPKNHALPIAGSKVFRIKRAGAREVRVPILEGEAPDAESNIQLGNCVVSDLPQGLPARSPIQVWISYDSNGIVRVMALDMTAGRYAQAALNRRSGLSEEELRTERKFVGQLSVS